MALEAGPGTRPGARLLRRGLPAAPHRHRVLRGHRAARHRLHHLVPAGGRRGARRGRAPPRARVLRAAARACTTPATWSPSPTPRRSRASTPPTRRKCPWTRSWTACGSCAAGRWARPGWRSRDRGPWSTWPAASTTRARTRAAASAPSMTSRCPWRTCAPRASTAPWPCWTWTRTRRTAPPRASPDNPRRGSAPCPAATGACCPPAWMKHACRMRCDDVTYVQKVKDLLARMPRSDITFVIAGGDVLSGDRFGRVGITLQGGAQTRRGHRRRAARTGQRVAARGRLPRGVLEAVRGHGAGARGPGPPAHHRALRPVERALPAHRAHAGPEKANTAGKAPHWEPFSLEDLEGSLRLGPEVQPRVLGHYTAQGIEYALFRYGLLSYVERLGYSRPARAGGLHRRHRRPHHGAGPRGRPRAPAVGLGAGRRKSRARPSSSPTGCPCATPRALQRQASAAARPGGARPGPVSRDDGDAARHGPAPGPGRRGLPAHVVPPGRRRARAASTSPPRSARAASRR